VLGWPATGTGHSSAFVRSGLGIESSILGLPLGVVIRDVLAGPSRARSGRRADRRSAASSLAMNDCIAV
jgi:hypothetical protein